MVRVAGHPNLGVSHGLRWGKVSNLVYGRVKPIGNGSTL